MGTYYLKSGATGTADGSSWANAFTTIGAALTAISTDQSAIVYISQSHSESQTTNLSCAAGGTHNSYTRKFLCVNDSAEPPTTLATGASFESTAGYCSFGSSGDFYFYGCSFKGNQSTTCISIAPSGASTYVFENCLFWAAYSTGSTSSIRLGSDNDVESYMEAINCQFKMSHAGTSLIVSGSDVIIRDGGSSKYLLDTPTPTAKKIRIGSSTRKTCNFLLEGVDLSNLGTTYGLIDQSGASTGANVIVRNCKIPSGAIMVGTTPVMQNYQSFKFIGCANGDDHDNYYYAQKCGIIEADTAVYRTGGAQLDAAPYSLKLVTNSSASGVYPVKFDPIVVKNEKLSGTTTLTLEILASNFTPQDDDIWMEVEVKNNSGVVMSSRLTTRASILSSGTNLTGSSADWEDTGVTSPAAYKLVTTFDQVEEGFAIVRLYVGIASKTLYICPKVTLA